MRFGNFSIACCAALSLLAGTVRAEQIIDKQTLGETSPVSPAVVRCHDNLYLAWRGSGNELLNVMVSRDGGRTFANKVVSTETSSDAPALACTSGRLYCAWKGSNNASLNVARVALDGAGSPLGLIDKNILPETSPVRPALAGHNGTLYLGWKGNGNFQLNVRALTENLQVLGPTYVSQETSPVAPALASHEGSLFIAWKGNGNDNLNVAQVALNGAVPTGVFNKAVLNDTSPLTPALASHRGHLYLAWRGDGNTSLNIMSSRDNGASFGNKYVSPERSSDSPALTTLGGTIFLAWKGDGNSNLNVEQLR